MLRVLHSADWHLGHSLHGVSRHKEHQQFLDWLLNELLDKQADALLIAGDIFDSANPSAVAQAQLYEFLVQAKQQQPALNIVIIGGNHDSAAYLDAPSSILNALGIHIVGGLHHNQQREIDWQRLIVPLTNAQGEIKAWCGAMPFLRHADLPSNAGDDPLVAGVKTLYDELFAQLQTRAKQGESLIMTGHCYMVNGNVSALSERKILGGNQHALPVELFPKELAYLALGHLHLMQKVGGHEHIRYSGSPIPLSFDESHYPHSVLQVDITDDGQTNITALRIPRFIELLRLPNGKDFACLSDVLAQLESLELADLPEPLQPFLELRIRLEQPEPSLRQQIETVLADLPVRLLKISQITAGSDTPLVESIEQRLEELQPLAVFQQCYRAKYDADAPDELTALFNELLEGIH
jgi:DNA repair protein SbcD/Mre11